MASISHCAVVSGSNTGIGYEIIRALASRLPTVLCSRSKDKGLVALAQLKADDETLDLRFHQLDIDSPDSVQKFTESVKGEFPGGVKILVNNAAIAFKGADPTPFKEQTGPTLRTNVYSTLSFTEAMLPLVRACPESRIVFLASQAGTYALSGCSRSLQQRWMDVDSLTKDGIYGLLDEFKSSVASGTHAQDGWPSSNYGISKLAIIAAAKVYAKTLDGLLVTSACPGYCSTNMTSHRGHRSSKKGSETPVWLATEDISSLVPGGFYYDKSQIM